jgi:hypothetical protein
VYVGLIVSHAVEGNKVLILKVQLHLGFKLMAQGCSSLDGAGAVAKKRYDAMKGDFINARLVSMLFGDLSRSHRCTLRQPVVCCLVAINSNHRS